MEEKLSDFEIEVLDCVHPSQGKTSREIHQEITEQWNSRGRYSFVALMVSLYSVDAVKSRNGPGVGTLFPALYKLEMLGLIVHRLVTPVRPTDRNRHEYRLTQEGMRRRALNPKAPVDED